MTTTTRPIFVYGSLRKGLGNHHLIANCAFAGEARTRSGYHLYDLGAFPGMVSIGRGIVLGEVYLVDDEALARLDRLEAHPRWYCRTPIQLDDGREVETYLLRLDQVSGRRVVRGGDWMQYVSEQAAKGAAGPM